MPYNPNDPNFQTSHSRVASFKNFIDNIGKEKEELKKMNRSSFENPGELNQTPGGRKHKYNKVTHKIDDLSKAEVVDDTKSIDGEENEHKYKIVENQSPQISNSIEYIRKNMKDYWDGGKAQFTEEDVSTGLVEFAKIHVKNAVKEIIKSEHDRVSDEAIIDKLTNECLENLYPLENIN